MSIDKHRVAAGWRYTVRVDLGPDPATRKRRQRKATCRTMREAKATEAMWHADIERGSAVDATKLTLGSFLDSWLQNVARHSVHPNTMRGYQNWARNYIVPTLGATRIDRLTALQIQAWVSRLLDGPRTDKKPGGYANKTVRSALGLLSDVLTYAVKTKTIAANPVAGVTWPRDNAKQLQTWDAMQVRHFLAVGGASPYRHAWMLAIGTGLRRGEILGLRWRDIDRGHRTVQVCGSLYREKGTGLHLGETKTPSSKRAVVLPEACLVALTQQSAMQKRWKLQAGDIWEDHGMVFSTHIGRPLDPEQMVRAFHAIAKRAGLPHMRFHGLRHTNATLLLHLGTNIKVVSERLGHATTAITQDTYSHTSVELQRQAADALDTILLSGTESGTNGLQTGSTQA